MSIGMYLCVCVCDDNSINSLIMISSSSSSSYLVCFVMYDLLRIFSFSWIILSVDHLLSFFFAIKIGSTTMRKWFSHQSDLIHEIVRSVQWGFFHLDFQKKNTLMDSRIFLCLEIIKRRKWPQTKTRYT